MTKKVFGMLIFVLAGVLSSTGAENYEFVKPQTKFFESVLPGWYEKRSTDGSISFVERDRLLGGLVKRVVVQEAAFDESSKIDAVIDLSSEDENEAFMDTFSLNGEPVLKMAGITKNAILPKSSGAKIMYSILSHQLEKLNRPTEDCGGNYLSSFDRLLIHNFLPDFLKKTSKMREKVRNSAQNGSFAILFRTIDGQEMRAHCNLTFNDIDAAYVVKIVLEQGAIEKHSHIIYGLISMLFEVGKNRINLLFGVSGVISAVTAFNIFCAFRDKAQRNGLDLGFVHFGQPVALVNPFNDNDIKTNQFFAGIGLYSSIVAMVSFYYLHKVSQPLLDDNFIDGVEHD